MIPIDELFQKIMSSSNLSRDAVEEKVDYKIQEFSGLIDKEGALLLVAKDFGVELQDQESGAPMEEDFIKNLKPRKYTTVVGRIVEIMDKKTFNRKDGAEGTLLPFNIQDVTGSIRCVAWDKNTDIVNEDSFALNEVVRVLNGFVKEGFRDGLEIHIGNKSKIELQPSQVDLKKIPEKMDLNKFVPIVDITDDLKNVNVEVYIERIEPTRSFVSKAGKEGKRRTFFITDKTISIRVTLWNDKVDIVNDLQNGQKVKIRNLRPDKGFFDKTQIELSSKSGTQLEKLNEIDSDITNSSTSVQNSGLKKISDFSTKSDIGDVEAKIIDIEEKREITIKSTGQNKLLQNLTIADETASIRITLWEDRINDDLQLDNSVKITGFYSKMNSYSNNFEGNISRNGSISKIEKDFEIDAEKITIPQKTSQQTQMSSTQEREFIRNINSNDFYEFKGTVVKEIKRVFIYEACEFCRKKISNCSCGKSVNSDYRMIINLTVDDGTQSIRTSLFNESAEIILSESAKKIHEYQENEKLDEFLMRKSLEIVGSEYIFQGKGKFSDYSEKYEVNVTKIQKLNVIQESKRLIKMIES